MRVLVVFVAMVMTACSTPPAPARRLIERSFATMGSSLQVSIWTADEATAVAAATRVSQEFDRLETLLSVWKDGSDVVRLNQAAGMAPVRVAPETLDVLAAAEQGAAWTGGKFDITFGALTDIWRFDHDQDNVVPDRAAIEARLPRVDFRAVRLDTTAGAAFISRPGMRIHLGGVGKGYAIDRAVAMLRAAGFTDFLLQAGGDLYAAGTNNGAPWALGIADPRRPDQVFAAVRMGDGTFSTSGDYERFFFKDGVRYHHLLDPDFGEPARGCRSVTILTNRAIVADMLSTGVFIMGPADGMALVERLDDVEAVIVTSANDVLVSSGLKGRLDIRARPTDAP